MLRIGSSRQWLEPRSGARGDGRAGAGHTLIETLIVLTLIGILTAIALPRIDVGGYQVDAAMQTVSSTLVAQQRISTLKQHDIVVAFDVAGGRLRIHEDANNDGIIDSDERVRLLALETDARFGVGVAAPRPGFPGPVAISRQQETWPALTFRRSGSTSEEAVIYLTTAVAAAGGGHAGHTRAIHVERATGRVSTFAAGPTGWQRRF
jgi:prepilin-type N-terminal cleavage/methylation domain-containing protein